MKKILLIVYAVLLASVGFAQLTLEHRYDSVDHFQIVNLDGFGQKYALSKSTAKEIRLYNDDHSLFRTINVNLPAGVPYVINNIWWMATKLVDNDTLIELGTVYYVGQKCVGIILKEDGSIFQTFDSVCSMQPVLINGVWKLLAKSMPYNTLVYDVSGTYTPVVDPNGDKDETTSWLFPNPMNDAATLKYELPAGVNDAILEIYSISGQKLRSYRVDGQFSSVLIKRGELPGGTYIYQLKAGDNAPVAKQFVIN